jgi:integrase
MKSKFPPYSSQQPDNSAKPDEIAEPLDSPIINSREIMQHEAAAYFAAVDRLKPYSVNLDEATAMLVQCLQIKGVGSLATLYEAAKFYAARHKSTTDKPIQEIADEFIQFKKERGSSGAYIGDLRYRLERFAEAFKGTIGSVSTSAIQQWLDGLEVGSQSYMAFRRVVYLLFEFAVKRDYCLDNPVMNAETVKARHGAVRIITPEEITIVLEAAPANFRACLAISAFAGLRSAEVQRLEWDDINLAERYITVNAGGAEMGGQRVVPITDNLALWLAKCQRAGRKIWKFGPDRYLRRIARLSKKSGVKWKNNALRHSFISYRLALVQDAAKVAIEAGSSSSVVLRHHKAQVTPAAAVSWFAVKPKATNVVPFDAGANPTDSDPPTIANMGM